MERAWKRGVWMAPGIGVSLLPKFVCPVCTPVYAAMLSFLGLGFLGSTTYLLPTTAIFLTIAVTSLAYRAGSRRGYGPLLIGLVAAGLVLVGKFRLDSTAVMLAGVGMLLAACVWNAWPRAVSCSACLPMRDGHAHQEGQLREAKQ